MSAAAPSAPRGRPRPRPRRRRRRSSSRSRRRRRATATTRRAGSGSCRRAARAGRAKNRRSPAQLRERVDVERQIPAVERHHEAEPDADLRGRDCHHGQREDLARAVVPVARERDQREVAGVEHQLEREQHDERVAADEDAERADPEQDGGDRDVPGDVRAVHQVAALRVCEPRITPPTAAMSKTTEVISNASRWSTRKTRPIQAGVPKAAPTLPWWERLPLACIPTATTISTSSAPAAATAANVCQLGPPDHGVSRRGPTYAITNRNITTTAPA